MTHSTTITTHELTLTADHTARSTAMLLMNEDLARARIRDLHAEAQADHLATRLVRAHRLEHRAEVANRRWKRRVESANRRARLAREAIH
jgi:hypothetical protein